MPTNFYMYFVAGLIPLLIGAVYYHEKVVGGAWMRANGFTAKDLEGANMAMIFGLAYFFSVVIAFILTGSVIHQGNVVQMMIPEVLESGSAAHQQASELLTQYGDKHRNFGHGAVHGVILTIFLIFPLISINALFERRSWKYIFIHSGYWLICLTLMGGLLCQTLEFAPL